MLKFIKVKHLTWTRPNKISLLFSLINFQESLISPLADMRDMYTDFIQVTSTLSIGGWG